LISKLFKLRADLLNTPYSQLPIMSEVDYLTKVVLECKASTKVLKVYLKTNQAIHLGKLLPHLLVVVPWAESVRVVMNPALSAAFTKARFFDAFRQGGATSAVSVLDSLHRTAAGDAAGDGPMIHDCLTTAIYDILASPQENIDSEEAWAEAKTKFTLNVSAFASWCRTLTPPQGTDDGLSGITAVMGAMETISKAASTPSEVTPNALKAAMRTVETDTLAIKFRDGMHSHGFGQALNLDANVVLASGEMDEECDSNFIEAVQSIYAFELKTEEGEDAIVIDAAFMDRAGSSLKEAVCGALDMFRVVMVRWSVARLSEELENLCEVSMELAKIIAVCDRIMWSDCHQKLNKVRGSWEEHLTTWESGQEWPPTDADMSADIAKHEAEVVFCDMVNHIIDYLTWSSENVANQDDEFKEQSSKLKQEAHVWQCNSALRDAIVEESSCVSKLLSCQLLAPTQEFIAFAQGKGGVLANAEKIIRLHKNSKDMTFQPSVQYADTAMTMPSVDDTVRDLFGDNEDFNEGEEAEGAEESELLDSDSLRTFCDDFGAGALATWVEDQHVGACFDAYATPFIKLAVPTLKAIVVNVEGADFTDLTAAQALCTVLPLNVVQNLSNALKRDVGNVRMEDALDLSDRSEVMQCSRALGRLLALCNRPTATVRALSNDDSDSWPRDTLAAVVHTMAYCVEALQLAAFMAQECLGDKEQVQSSSTDAGPAKKEVSPIIGSGLATLKSMLDLWPKRKAVMALDTASLRCCVAGEVMHFAVTWVAEKWFPFATSCAFRLINANLSHEVCQLKKATPEWSHIVTHSKYNSTLAKRHLMNELLTKNLLGVISSVFSLTSSVSSLVSELDAGEACKDALEEADSALDHGRATMTLVAAVGLVEGPRSSDVSDKARRLLKCKTIPEALRARLQKLVEVE
jgi:hypothetical protein